MFSGLVESVGTVLAVTPIPEGLRVRIRSLLTGELSDGDSIAVNGVCLTVVAREGEAFSAELSPETSRVTTLGALSDGTSVNLERPLRVDDRLGGHFVLGHVDGRGRIEAVQSAADFHRVTVSCPSGLRPLMVEKGSIAVDGISLTIAALGETQFDVHIVPYTWDHTNLQKAAVNDAVNLECDIIGKYVVNAVRVARNSAESGN